MSTKTDRMAEVETESEVVRGRTERGFQVIEFKDKYGSQCSLQQSSLAENMEPGTSAVWLGIDNPNPQILARDAHKLGIDTKGQVTGWVGVPVHPDIMLTTRMHLDLKQVEWLIVELTNWAVKGKLKDKV